jgi:predicted ATPase
MSLVTQSLEKAFRERQHLAEETSRLGGHFEALFEDKARCILSIEESRGYLEHKDEVQSVLKALHNESVEQTRVLYEDVLTGLLKDIFPNDSENSRVHLNLGVKRSQAALSVEVSNEKGNRRDVFLDKGGSVKSIIAIGLRFIALSRSNRRRLVVLDEADSELNPLFIPRFAKMMAQLASKIGMQVIYVSHHDHREFEGHARIIRLTRKNGKVSADVISDNANSDISGWEGEKNIGMLMDGAGLTDIRLVNVKQHENTMIELSPLVNVIAGTNDVGKSTIIQAIECVARNKGREGLIRDEQDKLRIEIGIEGGQRIIYQYKRRGSRKTKYSFFDHRNENIEESRDGISCPDWVHANLGMKMHKNHDLHIGTQANTNFVLDPNISEHKRAEVLSLNRLSGDSQRMIEEHNRLIDQHKKETSRFKKELSRINLKLRELSVIQDVVQTLPELEKEEHEIRAIQKRIDSMGEKDSAWSKLEAKRTALSSIESAPPADSDFLNDIHKVGQLQNILAKWSVLDKRRLVLSDGLSEIPVEAAVPDENLAIKGMIITGKKWSSLEFRNAMLSEAIADLSGIEVSPVADEISSAAPVLSDLEGLFEKRKGLMNGFSSSRIKLEEIRASLDELIGEACVTCGQTISGEHIHD